MANHTALIRNANLGRTVTRRGKRFIEFDMGSGQKRFVTTIDPLHYGDGSQEIDTTWTAAGGAWQWQITANDFNLFARDTLNAGDIIQWLDTRSGENVTLQPLALNWVNNANDSRQQITQPQAVIATADDATLTWTNGYGAGRHFRYTAHPRKLVKEIIIDSVASLPVPTVANPYLEIEFILKRSAGVTLYVDGVAWDNSTKTTTAQAIEFRTASGQVVWQFDTPVATDAAGNTTPGIMQLRRQGANRYVTVRFDKMWIDAAVFPIALDPTLTDGYGGDVTTYKDTWIYQGAPTTNYGTGTALQLGKNGSDVVRSLFEFDLSSIAATATCNSATFTVQFLSNENYSATSIEVYELLSGREGWTEAGATWNNYAAGSAWTTAGCGSTASDRSATSIGSLASTTPGSHNISLTTSAVENWFGASNQNYGFLFRALVETDWERMEVASSDHATTSYRPVLVVDYTEGGSPVTVSLSAATLTASAQAFTVVPGAVSRTLNSASLSGVGQAISISSGSAPLSISLNPASTTLIGQTLAVQPGAITIQLNSANLTAASQNSTLVLGAVTIQLGSATISASGQSTNPMPGAVTVQLGEATLAVTGQALALQATTSVPLSIAVLTANGQVLDVVPVTTINLSSANLVAIPQVLTIVEGTVTILLSSAIVNSVGNAITIIAGTKTTTLSAANISATGQAISITAPEGLSVILNTALLSAVGQVITTIPGAVSISISNADLQALGQLITISAPIPGTTVSLNPASATINGLAFAIVPGAVTLPLNTANLFGTAEVLTIQPGTMLIPLGSAQMTLTALSSAIELGGSYVSLSNATISAEGQTIGFITGPITVALDNAALTALGQLLLALDTTGRVARIGFTLVKRQTDFSLSDRTSTFSFSIPENDIYME